MNKIIISHNKGPVSWLQNVSAVWVKHLRFQKMCINTFSLIHFLKILPSIKNQIIFGTPFTMLGWFVNALLYYFTHRKGKSSFRDKFSRLNWTFSWEATGSGFFVNKSSKSSQKADILKTAEDINRILVKYWLFFK